MTGDDHGIMETLTDLLARDRRSDRPALSAPGDPAREYDYRRLRTDARRTGNFLSHLGVRTGRAVGIVGVAPEVVLAFLGTALLGGVARFAPPPKADLRDANPPDDGSRDGTRGYAALRALVAPTDRASTYELAPGGTRVAYGGPPEHPGTAHFERDVWSENPAFPPTDVSPADPVLATGERVYTHADLLATAGAVVERAGVDAEDGVALRAPLADPGAVAAGLVAPLLAGASIVLPGATAGGDGAAAVEDAAIGDVAVAAGDTPEERVIDPSTVR